MGGGEVSKGKFGWVGGEGNGAARTGLPRGRRVTSARWTGRRGGERKENGTQRTWQVEVSCWIDEVNDPGTLSPRQVKQVWSGLKVVSEQMQATVQSAPRQRCEVSPHFLPSLSLPQAARWGRRGGETYQQPE